VNNIVNHEKAIYILQECSVTVLRNKEAQRRLEAAEFWCLKKMLKISCTTRKSNEAVLKEAEEKNENNNVSQEKAI
jgi:hypothetical protein